jgi:hypothetical protein
MPEVDPGKKVDLIQSAFFMFLASTYTLRVFNEIVKNFNFVGEWLKD